ncbi:hypothetical protein [Chryseobacterium sp.]|uniref:hypothetical protein n=1 Tax=Chryseobacterium sp. TaxID=1871047 RepID=UPI0011C7C05E|nr:hypothetical protein [Chryseobacterium sp.]TXF79098.1 hypothetical protein FUA25_01525 [Chryseobacterium sp.]
MKKIILGVLLAGTVMSCKKIQPGGNLGALKLEEGTERYSEDQPGSANTVHAVPEAHADADSTAAPHNVAEKAKTDSVKGPTSPEHR